MSSGASPWRFVGGPCVLMRRRHGFSLIALAFLACAVVRLLWGSNLLGR